MTDTQKKDPKAIINALKDAAKGQSVSRKRGHENFNLENALSITKAPLRKPPKRSTSFCG